MLLFMPLPSVVWPEAYWFLSYASMCASQNIVNTIPCRVTYLTHFHLTYINGAFWDRDEHFTIWGQKVKVTE